MTEVALGFAFDCIRMPAEKILPSHKVPQGVTTTKKVVQIRASIEEIGLIEPLSITPEIRRSGQHMLLDGHVRFMVLRELGESDVPCIVAKDDEAYTYNNRINRLSTVQEHFMIRRAIDRGVSADRIARAFSVDVTHPQKKAKLLEGICQECQELLKDRIFSVEIARFLRQMKSTRQIECAELMLAANNLSVSYAEAMLLATLRISWWKARSDAGCPLASAKSKSRRWSARWLAFKTSTSLSNSRMDKTFSISCSLAAISYDSSATVPSLDT